ncbi:unnamed protein product [Orchesella dallaii]|uniref:Uncharacterized protein n=1 Tax=Orchesella dallaii TaxID=48710 RepID=A0ABP1QHV9_9HEXA
MPGKKAPDYFPLNLSMSGIAGIGKGSYYGDVSPVLGYHHGKFDNSGLGMIMGSPINTLTNNSPNTNAFSLSEYITLNGIPPVNSEDEEEDEDDIVSQSGSESVSIQGSDDLDVDIDDVDSLVLNIRDKLQMAPNGGNGGSVTTHHWTSVGSLGNNSTSECNSPASGNASNDLLIHHHHHHHHHRTSPLSFPSSSSISPSPNSSNNSGSSRRRRNHPYTHVRSMNFNHQLHRKQSCSSGASSSSSTSTNNVNKGHNSYYRRFHPNPPGSIGKSKSSSSHQKNWWATSMSKGCGSGSSISKQFSRTDDPFQLLQELLESGSLIKEAVRRLNRKCLNSSNGNNTNPGTTPSNSIANSVIFNSGSNSASSTSNSSSTRFSFIDEDTENSYPVIPISNQ